MTRSTDEEEKEKINKRKLFKNFQIIYKKIAKTFYVSANHAT